MATGRTPIPGEGFGLPDLSWLNGLAGGDNMYAQSGVTAFAGGGQGSALPIGQPNSQGIFASLIEVDTVATAADSVQLPQAIAGRWMLLRNAGANSMNVYASPVVNRQTNATDSVNGGANGAAVAVAANHGAIVFCAKNGAWSMLVV